MVSTAKDAEGYDAAIASFGATGLRQILLAKPIDKLTINVAQAFIP